MKMNDFFTPGIMLSQVWPQSRECEGETLRAIDTVLRNGFYKALQSVEIPYTTERRAVAQVIKEADVTLTYCLARILNENKLNLSDLDTSIRQKSWKKVIDCLEDACESGASAVSLVSGAIPKGEAKRLEGLKALEESLYNICEAARQASDIKIIIEPLDYFAHKKNTLGTTIEGKQICNNLKDSGLSLFLCLDTAHLILNEENIADAVKLGGVFTPEFHFCNCVTDKSNPMFGDHHIPFGKPGVLDIKSIAVVMEELIDIGYFSNEIKPKVFCEVIKRSDEDSISLMKYCQEILEGAWGIVGEKVKT